MSQSQSPPSAALRDLYSLQGTLDVIRHESQRLAGNRLNDPHVRNLVVYLPPEYATQPERRFPAIYCLTGYTGSGSMLLNLEGWTPNLPQRLERLCSAGKAKPMILVMPDCFTRLGGSQYLNSTATGPYEDYLIQEIVPSIDARYRTLPVPAHRGVMGKSSGGYGAIVQGMKHPEILGGVACHSGDIYFEYCYLPDFPRVASLLRERGGLIRFLEAFDQEPRKTHESVQALNIVAMASCYSPNPACPPFYFDLPFREETGEMRPDVWQRWLEHDPLRMLDSHLDALRGARLLYIDCGTRDEFNLHVGARILAGRLVDHEIPHIYEEFPDGHMRITYRYERSLTLLSEALAE